MARKSTKQPRYKQVPADAAEGAVDAVAARYGVRPSTVRTWRKKLRTQARSNGHAAPPPPASVTVQRGTIDLRLELARAKAENAELRRILAEQGVPVAS